MTANADLARQLRDQADDHMRQRRILLVAAVALGDTTTVTAAYRVLAEWGGPRASEAIELLSQLAGMEPQ